MSDNLKTDILKAVADSQNATNNTSNNADNHKILLNDPQISQYSLDKSFKHPQRLAENLDKNNEDEK